MEIGHHGEFQNLHLYVLVVENDPSQSPLRYDLEHSDLQCALDISFKCIQQLNRCHGVFSLFQFTLFGHRLQLRAMKKGWLGEAEERMIGLLKLLNQKHKWEQIEYL
ncbi:hypothetical protein MKW98_009340 [Papaver atlanticum]|uniref:Uncharacterized protein n=1 Tax=Papaver atlanticum TaxID=357466 RepID=A0AAD4X4U4_9MAGN|nr:hypothetical protein MKW98_009340 [Papaver atlanticum]